MDRTIRNREMTDFFTRKADGYDEVHLKLMGNKLAITGALQDSTRRVLDLGVGTGLELIPLFERFPQATVTGVDITAPMLEELKKRDFASRITVICGDFFEVPFGEGYDAVISSSALHHFTVEDKHILFAKAFAALRPGGQFINSDKYAHDQAEEDKEFAEYAKDPNAWPHMDTPLTAENEGRILEDVGFTQVKLQVLNDPYWLVSAVKPL